MDIQMHLSLSLISDTQVKNDDKVPSHIGYKLFLNKHRKKILLESHKEILHVYIYMVFKKIPITTGMTKTISSEALYKKNIWKTDS